MSDICLDYQTGTPGHHKSDEGCNESRALEVENVALFHPKPKKIAFTSSSYFSRGWRIQWSIVPEVSEPMVRQLPASCFTAVSGVCICGGKYLILLTLLSFLTQEPPKEDLTVSEKFQLVLDVAQKAQVQHRSCHISNQRAQMMKVGS